MTHSLHFATRCAKPSDFEATASTDKETDKPPKRLTESSDDSSPGKVSRIAGLLVQQPADSNRQFDRLNIELVDFCYVADKAGMPLLTRVVIAARSDHSHLKIWKRLSPRIDLAPHPDG
jgi:hypothetical protein